MLKFMDYVLYAFGDAADWDRDNTYSSLTTTSDGICCVPSTLSPLVDLQL